MSDIKLPSFKVCATRCDECLFGPKPLVDKKRMAEVVKECRAGHTHFICHKYKIGMCRGFYETQPQPLTLTIALAFTERGLGRIEFIEHEEKK